MIEIDKDAYHEKGLCVVAGGCGFLGSHLVRALARDGYRVRVLDPSAGKHSRTLPAETLVEYLEGSSMNLSLLQDALTDADVFFFFSGTTMPADSNARIPEDVAHHLTNDLRAIEVAARAGVKKILFPSSGGTVYGIPEHIPIPESHPTHPRNAYGIIKLTMEKYLHLYEHLTGMKHIILRYGNPYGERQQSRSGFGVIPTFLEHLVHDRPLTVLGDGSMGRDFLYIDDAVTATLRAMEYEGPLRIFNIGSGAGVSIRDLIATMERVTGKRASMTYLPMRKSDVQTIVLDITRARQELGWTPTTSLEEGIARTWTWMQEQYARS